MEQFIIFVVVVIILYFISTKFARKEAMEYLEESDTPKETADLSKYDAALDAVVDFSFSCPNTSFLIASKPNIIVNGEKHKIIEDVLRLRLPRNVKFKFGVPYMKGESFKRKGVFEFEPGYHYEVQFKAPIFVFQKAKMKIVKVGPYKG